MKLNRRRFMELAGTAGAALITTSQSSVARVETDRIGGRAFGGAWTIVFDPASETEALKRKVEHILNRIDRSMSPYIASSEISQFNAMNAHETFYCSQEFGHVAQVALDIARLTNGAFDPTVGPQVNALGFGPIIGARNTDWRSIVSGETHLRKTHRTATLDLCGIAKGYALDLVRACLLENGVRSAFIEIGGEVTTIGRHPEGRQWRVAIQSPEYGSVQAIAVITPKSSCLATSGIRTNGVNGPVTTSHIISKSGGQAQDAKILSVSVLAKSATLADALATALCAMKATQAEKFASANGIDALFAIETHDGFRTSSTGRFSAYEIGTAT